jgi:hypothetical protein
VQAGSETELLFTVLDQEPDDVITEAEFMSLVTVLKVKWEMEEVATHLERIWPQLLGMASFQRFRKIVLSDYFQYGKRPFGFGCFVGIVSNQCGVIQSKYFLGLIIL